MNMPMNTPEYNLFVSAANYVKTEIEKENSDWADSPFEWILSLPSGSKGKLGKKLIKQWCALSQISVDNCPDSEADMLLNGHRIEIKFSTLWSSGIYKFQQIRDQNYEYCICLGISPHEVHCWVLSKSILKKFVIGHLGQHTGLSGKETAWFGVNPKNPSDWIKQNGGSLEQAYKILKTIHPKRK